MGSYVLILLLDISFMSVTFSMVFWMIIDWVFDCRSSERNSLEFKQQEMNFALPKNIFFTDSGYATI